MVVIIAARVLSIIVYLLSWVANGEWMQAISTGGRASSYYWGGDTTSSDGGGDNSGGGRGSDDDDTNNSSSDSSNVAPPGFAYNKPAFLTWYAYCHLLLAWIPVVIYVVVSSSSSSSSDHRRHLQDRKKRLVVQQPSSNKKYDDERRTTNSNSTTTTSASVLSAMSIRARLRTMFVLTPFPRRLRNIFIDSELSMYMTTEWSKNVEDFWSSCWKCLTFNYILIGLNVLWIVGLTQDISVPMSNAIYQSQIPATVLLSMYHDDDDERRQNEKGGRNNSNNVVDERQGKKHKLKNSYQRRRRRRHERERRQQHWRRVLVGTLISSVGIGMVVIPPLLTTNGSSSSSSSNVAARSTTQEESSTMVVVSSSSSSNTTAPSSSFLGIFVTFLSAMISAAYQVAWKVLMDEKDDHHRDGDESDERNGTEMVDLIYQNVNDDDDDDDDEEGQQLLNIGHRNNVRLNRQGNDYQMAATARNSNNDVVKQKGLIKTFATLGVMGICNILFGWPVLLLLHWSGIETIDLKPIPKLWKALTINSLIETLFDTSCAVAIYMTSPVVTSIVAPLTIPISFFWDVWFRRAADDGHDAINSSGGNIKIENENLWLILIGSILIVIGVVRIEMKPPPHRQPLPTIGKS